MTEQLTTIDEVQKRIESGRVAMVTTVDERGTLSARPVTLQKIDDHGDAWFLVDANADWVQPAANGPVNAAFVDERTWVSFAGRADLFTDEACITDLMDAMSENFFDESSQPVALRVVTDRIEWWAAPNKLSQLIELAKAKATDHQPDLGASGTIEA